MTHECPRNGCNRAVDDERLLCAPCWRPVPLVLRRALNDAWDHSRGRGSAAHNEAVAAVIRHVNGEPEPAAAPKTPHGLWLEAGGGTLEYSRERYLELLREHGHLIGPGNPGSMSAPGNLPCGWPGPQRPGWDPDDG